VSDIQSPETPADLRPEDLHSFGGSSDTTAPTAPGISGAVIVAATITVTLTLTAGTDPDDSAGVLTYNIYRDAAKIATAIVGPTWSETKPADGTAHSYGASMSDPAGNEGPVTTLTPNVTWSAPSSGTSGGSYPVYISVPAPSVNTPLTFKQGNIGQQLVMMLFHANGEPIDLTGKLVRMRMQPIAGGALKINALVVVLLASLGIISYTFTGTDTDTPGSYNLEFLITNADGSPGSETYPADSYLRLKIIASEG
jgi:hypothetical protein